ncbi:vitellogenin-6 [Lingula anatina]|uniref:Vitellogenin-6 n=1 Tax=Lingula anatina TaxID=7574 RepID=A0A1S3JHG9_LINAN|nr:vitellogenin-6 [Lingula anatina]|eukprot:XP_013409581.1 vitellogenin-6 [Lingula anatina]
MKFTLLLLLGACFASASRRESVFRSGREYAYVYDGQVLTGIPGSSQQYSGVRIRATVRLQFTSASQVQCQLEGVQVRRLNEKVVQGEPTQQLPLEIFQDLQQEQQQVISQELQRPFQISYEDGIVKQLQTEQDDPYWSVNIKKGVLSVFQVNLQQYRALDEDNRSSWDAWFTNIRRQSTQNRNVYKVMEDGVSGDCETLYQVGSYPYSYSQYASQNVINVTKVRNYRNCLEQPLFQQSIYTAVRCDSCNYDQQQPLLRSGTQARYNISSQGQNGNVIESAVVESQHVFTPYSEQGGSAVTYINQCVRIQGANQNGAPIPAPTNPQIHQENLRMIIPKREEVAKNPEWQPRPSTPSEIVAKKQQVGQLLSQITAELDQGVPVEAPKYIAALLRSLRQSSTEQLAAIWQQYCQQGSAPTIQQGQRQQRYGQQGQGQQSYGQQDQRQQKQRHQGRKQQHHQEYEQQGWRQQLNDQQSQRARQVLFDVLPLVSNGAIVDWVATAIKRGQLADREAAQVLSGLAFSPLPNLSMADQLLALYQNLPASYSPIVRRSCLLSAGALINASCTWHPYPSQRPYARDQGCTETRLNKYVQQLQALYNQGQNRDEKILVLKAFGNAGIEGSFPWLKKVIQDKQQPQELRVVAVNALRNLVGSIPNRINDVCLTVYFDGEEPTELRLAAFRIFIGQSPSRTALQLVAQSLRREQDLEVGSYVYSYLITVANASHPCYRTLARRAQFALRFCRPYNPGFQYSKAMHYSKYYNDLKIGFAQGIHKVNSPYSLLPRSLAARYDLAMFGFSTNLFEVGFRAEGLQSILEAIFAPKQTAFNIIKKTFKDALQSPRHSARGARHYQQREGPVNQNIVQEQERIKEHLKLQGCQSERLNGQVYYRVNEREVAYYTLDPLSVRQLLTDYFDLQQIQSEQGMPVDYVRSFVNADATYQMPTCIGLPLTLNLTAITAVRIEGQIKAKTTPAGSLIPDVISIEASLTPRIAFEKTYRMGCDGVLFTASAAAKLRVSSGQAIRGNAQYYTKTSQLTAQIHAPQQEVTLVGATAVPMTCWRDVPGQPSQPAQEQCIEIAGQEVNVPQQRRYRYGGEGLGVEFEIFAQYVNRTGAPFAPFHPLVGKQNLQVKVRPAGNAAQAYQITFEYRRQQVSEINEPLSVKISPVPGRQQGGGSVAGGSPPYTEQQQDGASEGGFWSYFGFGGQEEEESSKIGYSSPAYGPQPAGPYERTQILFAVQSQGGSQPRQAKVSLAYTRDQESQRSKVSAHVIVPTPIPGVVEYPWRACVDGQVSYPRLPDNVAIAQVPQSQKVVDAGVTVAWGRQCSNPQIAIKALAGKGSGQIQQESEQIQQLREQCQGNPQGQPASAPQHQQTYRNKYARQSGGQAADWANPSSRAQNITYERAVACERLRQEAARLQQWDVLIQYQQLPYWFRAAISSAYRYAKYQQYSRLSVEDIDVNNQPNKIRIQATSIGSPNQPQIAVRCQTPTEISTFQSIPLPFALPTVSLTTPIVEATLQQASGGKLPAVCKVQGGTVKTYDGIASKLPKAPCDVLLSKDCSPRESFMVILESNKANDQIGIRIALKKKVNIQLTPQGKSAEIIVNGAKKAVPPSGELKIREAESPSSPIIATVRKTANLYVISCQELGLSVQTDLATVKVQNNPAVYRGKTCGLCGNMNGQTKDDLEGPRKERYDNPEHFAYSYLIPSSRCPAEMIESLKSNKQIKAKVPACKPIFRNKKETREYRGQQEICFSLRPVRQCPAACKKVGIQREQLPYHCLPANAVSTKQMDADINKRPLKELITKPEHMRKEVEYPEDCQI